MEMNRRGQKDESKSHFFFLDQKCLQFQLQFKTFTPN